MRRILGRSEIETSALGMGCWAIGGPWTFKGGAAGWGQIVSVMMPVILCTLASMAMTSAHSHVTA